MRTEGAGRARVTTPAGALRPAKKNGTPVRVRGKEGWRTFTVFSQQRMGDPWFYHHGCAVCALTTILREGAAGCEDLTPRTCRDEIEKKVLGEEAFRENYRLPLLVRMPVSLSGITRILDAYGLKTRYVRRFARKDAARQIEAHLARGGQVIVETTAFPGRRWAGSKHTMALLGLTEDGRIIIADSADRAWSGSWQRIKLGKPDDLVRAMFPCSSDREPPYYRGRSSGGGYILIGDAGTEMPE